MTKADIHFVSRYESRLEKIEEIEFPFEEIDHDFQHFGKDYYSAIALKAIKDFSKEHCIVLYLRLDGSVSGYEIVSVGSEFQNVFSTWHIARTALMLNTFAVVQIHNHPQTSVARSSEQDMATIETLRQGLEAFHIKLVDSIVVTDNGHFSSTWKEDAEKMSKKKRETVIYQFIFISIFISIGIWLILAGLYLYIV